MIYYQKMHESPENGIFNLLFTSSCKNQCFVGHDLKELKTWWSREGGANTWLGVMTVTWEECPCPLWHHKELCVLVCVCFLFCFLHGIVACVNFAEYEAAKAALRGKCLSLAIFSPFLEMIRSFISIQCEETGLNVIYLFFNLLSFFVLLMNLTGLHAYNFPKAPLSNPHSNGVVVPHSAPHIFRRACCDETGSFPFASLTHTHARKQAALRWYNAVITMEICWRWTLSGQCQECPPVSLHLQIWFQPWELLRAREDGSLRKRPRQGFKSQIQGQNLWEMLACTLN